jgi:hypothetical protein
VPTVLKRRGGKKPAKNPDKASSGAITTALDRHGRKVRKAHRSGILEESLVRSDGKRARVLTLDANSATFTTDLTLMFEKNVARARREHKKKIGALHRADHKA